nr:MAG: zinc-binding loop region of homing endonuclease [Bacteriophage sp.]
MEEIWKDISGYEGKYQVSNFGRIKNSKGLILKTIKDKDSYLTINLYKNRKIKTFKIHRLVAEAFISNPNNYPCVNHKDENKENNCIENIEWCNHKYNSNYGTVIERRVKNTDWKQIAEKQSKTVLQFKKDGDFVKEWLSTQECGRNGFDSGAVSSCCNGKRKSHKGFIWKYKE